MKKIAIFLLIIIAVISTVAYLYLSNINTYKSAQKENAKFEIYIDKEVTGTEITTLINKAIDQNKQNEIKKDNKGKYIENNENSLNIDIKFIDNDTTYNMEKLFDSGIETFLAYYRNISFKCSEVQYHEKNDKIKYMLFEQITQ